MPLAQGNRENSFLHLKAFLLALPEVHQTRFVVHEFA